MNGAILRDVKYAITRLCIVVRADAGRAWIKEKLTAAPEIDRPVGMPKYDHLCAWRCFMQTIQITRLAISFEPVLPFIDKIREKSAMAMHQRQLNAIDLQRKLLDEPVTEPVIAVAAHRRHRGNLLQLGNDAGYTHIPGVQNL